MMKRRSAALLAVMILIGIGAVFAMGPRVHVAAETGFDSAQIGPDPAQWLAEREAAVPGIRAGLEKEIVWAYPYSRAKTPISIVYVHGFSSSKGEVRPLPDLVAKELNANLFYTRLAGHGQDGAALGAATADEWIDDFAEAVAIGRLIGERVIIVATSTGGSLAVWGATRPELMEHVAGLVLISPNMEIAAGGSSLLTWPWGRQMAELVSGRERGVDPHNELHGRYWTTRYPTAVAVQVAGIARLARQSSVETASVPALFVISDGDRVVVPATTREVAARWGGSAEIETVTDSADPGQHVIAGDAFSPNTTQRLADRVIGWIRALPR